jgi:uncharacterized protein (DUF305 family)
MLFHRSTAPRLPLIAEPFVIAVPFVIAALLSACGSSSPKAAAAPPETSAAATPGSSIAAKTSDSVPTDSVPPEIPADADFNAADVTFARGMIPHHQQAVTMSISALDPARKAGPAVLDLATRIQGAQDPEIKLMTGWLTTWAQPLQAPGHADMAGMDMGDGIMTDAEMKSLDDASGADFDKLWMQMMVRHHKGAVKMAIAVITDGKSPDAIALGKTIITTQEAEIAEMKKLLGE